MGSMLSSLFGGKPKKPQIVSQPPPVQEVNQSDEKQKIMLELAKKRRATILNQQGTDEAKIRKQTLGAG